MDKIKDIFLKNTGLKLISLVVAILLWLVSMNLNNPQMTQTYNVPISLLNLSNVNDTGMVVLNESELAKTQAYIKIKATRNDLISLDTSRIKATIDFSPVDITNSQNIGKEVPVSVYVSVPSISYEVVDYSPKTVNVVFDELTTKDVPIEINQTGKPENNYEVIGSPQISPEYVTVKGAKSYVDKIAKAKVDVNIDGASSNVSDQYEISILDENDKNITNNFSLSSQNANVTTQVQRIDSLLIGTPMWEGEPAEGYEVVDMTWSPKYVDVIGDEEIIKSIEYLELPSINVSGAISDVTQVINLNDVLKPLGISVQEGSSAECTVTVKVEEVVSKIIEIPTENIIFANISDSNKSQLDLPETVPVTVTGPTSEIANLDPDTISLTCDFANFAQTQTDIEVDVTCSNQLIDVETPIRLRVIEKEEDEIEVLE